MPSNTSIIKQSTILIPSGPAHALDKKHLHIILNDPTHVPTPIIYSSIHLQAGDFVQIVSISSCYPNIQHDPTCLLQIGDHEFIKHDSYVFYAQTRIINLKDLDKGITDGSLTSHKEIKTDIFKRVHAGVGSSEDTPIKMIRFWKEFC